MTIAAAQLGIFDFANAQSNQLKPADVPTIKPAARAS
jgi:hypothetical protein